MITLVRYLSSRRYRNVTSFGDRDDSENDSEHVGMVGAICFLM